MLPPEFDAHMDALTSMQRDPLLALLHTSLLYANAKGSTRYSDDSDMVRQQKESGIGHTFVNMRVSDLAENPS